jgi:predicted metalloprotease
VRIIRKFESEPHAERPSRVRRASQALLATIALTGVACEEKAEKIDVQTEQAVIASTLASLDRSVAFWNHRYDQMGIDRNQVPNLTLEYDDDDGSILCDVFTPTEEGEMFFCNVDGKMVLNPRAVHNLVLYVGLDPENPQHLSAVTDVLAGHEFGHFLQKLAGVDAPVSLLERQADCLVGAQLAVTGFGHEISTADAEEALLLYRGIMRAIGGGPDHGTGTEREASFMIGYEVGVPYCLV